MGDHDTPGTCLSSSESHQSDHDVRDILLHYFGCLKGVAHRKRFYDTLKPHQQERIKNEEARIRAHRELFNRDHPGLVRLFTTSLSHLRQSEPYRSQRRPESESDPVNSHGEPAPMVGKQYHGLNAHMILFKDSKPYRDPDYPEEFPNQKIPLDDLLYKEDKSSNPLMKECPKDMIRYFHLPANNMNWVEEAIARHYNEKKPEYEGIFRRPEQPSKTYMMLRPEFWWGQQHGGRKDTIHARHMRPRCAVISTDPDSMEESPKNLVLFMPYLHWETDRRRSKFDQIIRNLTEEHNKQQEKKIIKTRLRVVAGTLSRQNGNAAPVNPPSATANSQSLWARLIYGKTPAQPDESENSDRPPKDYKIYHTMTDVVEAARVKAKQDRPLTESKIDKNSRSRMMMPCTVLGQVLFRAAILAEAMDIYHDQEILRKDLHRSPPLHPRRTLDQAYYWTLRTTKKRDRDQVVYRGTAPKKEFMHHHYCEKKEPEKCGHRHCKWNPEDGCRQCQEDVRKVARVVMVDQLWLWILDGNTIITCFPKRWGRNKPDPSAVHKGLRLRLKVARKDEIQSVYDLALIIIDQCSRVFFDRTKTADRQPRVMDIFASAIGDVTNKQTIAYEHFWHYTQQASEVYKSKDAIEKAGAAKALLDINPEGKLVREIKDILDELHIMIHIKKLQERVLKEFMTHANHITEEDREAFQEGEASPSLDKGKAARKAALEKRARWWRKEYAHDIEAGLKNRMADLHNLKESAENAEKALAGLLGLKQQQASVVHAREAVRQADETLRQGRSIMLFTVITIVFLPLSFFSSIFGMNNAEFKDNTMSIQEQLRYMLPVSFVVIATSCILAFSSFVRAGLAFIFNITWTWFVTKTRIYELWVEFKIDSQSLGERTRTHVRLMKERARKERQARHEAEVDRKAREEYKRRAGASAPIVRVEPGHLPGPVTGTPGAQNHHRQGSRGYLDQL